LISQAEPAKIKWGEFGVRIVVVALLVGLVTHLLRTVVGVVYHLIFPVVAIVIGSVIHYNSEFGATRLVYPISWF